MRNVWANGSWIGTFARRQGIANRALVRSAYLRRAGSPWYGYNMPVTAATVTHSNDLENQFPQAKKYAYCDEIEIVNNDVVDLLLQLNGTGSAGFLIPAGSIFSESDHAFYTWAITNQDAVAASTLGSIRVTMRRMPETADTAARGKSYNVRS